MAITLTPVTGISDDKLTALQNYCVDKFWHSVTSRSAQVQGMYQRWLDNYAGKPLEAVRTTPYYKASNFVPQLIRMHTDILSARIIGMLFGTRPFWRIKTLIEDGRLSNEALMATANWMDQTCQSGLNFYEPVDLSMFLTVKTGTQVVKSIWIDETKYFASPQGKILPRRKEGLEFDVVPFDDFFPYPVTARNLLQCLAKFHRINFAKEEIEYRKNIKTWESRACDLLLHGGDKPNQGNPREANANQAGIALTVDVTRPFVVVEGHIDFELQPGRISKLIVTFNPRARSKDGLLRCIYDYSPNGEGMFDDFRILPRENLFWGYSVPEILEQSQEEQAQIHNARRDGNAIAMVPGWKKKRLADVGNPNTEWYPGKVFEVDDMSDLEPLNFGATYNSLIEEENALMALAERYTGISPAMQGFGSGPMGKKGIYASQATLALLSEGNKRLDIYLKRMRMAFHGVGNKIFCNYRDFKSDAKEWQVYGKTGALVQQAFRYKETDGLNGLFFGIAAADASANKEVDRSNLLLMANTMAAYYRQILELAPQVAQSPDGSPFKELGLQILDGAKDLANRILFAFDIYDRDRLVPDIRKLLGGGSPDEQNRAAEQAGVPQAEEPVSTSGLSDLSDSISKIAGGLGGQNGVPPGGQGRVI